MLHDSGIYCITNTHNNKHYIGSTKNLYTRKYSHWNKLKLNKHGNIYLQRAYNKYGKENFIFTILEVCNIKELRTREIYYINKFQSFLPKYGYNMMLPNVDYLSHNESTRKKMSINSKGKNQKAILQYSEDGVYLKEWNSLKEAAQYLNCDLSCLCHALKKERKSYGFYWRYKKDISIKHNKIPTSTKFSRKGTSIILYNDKESFTFSSIKKASEFIGVVPSTIFRARRIGRKIQNFSIRLNDN